MVSDPSYCRNVGETLVLLLDRQEDFEKAFMLGKAFVGYVKGLIQYETFLRLAAAIDQAFINDPITWTYITLNLTPTMQS
jgi:hypothetical protein